MSLPKWIEGMPVKVGLTGGIGTGKSVVARFFRHMGVPVLDADTVAKRLMEESEPMKAKLIEAFGLSIYKDGKLQRTLLSEIVFKDKDKLSLLNSIVHPDTIQYAHDWMEQNTAPYAIKEAAIMIEAGSYKDLDYIIGVDAPESLRIQRVMRRDGVSEQAVRERMSKQMDNDEKMKYCHYVIINDERHSLIKQVLAIHQSIMSQIKP